MSEATIPIALSSGIAQPLVIWSIEKRWRSSGIVASPPVRRQIVNLGEVPRAGSRTSPPRPGRHRPPCLPRLQPFGSPEKLIPGGPDSCPEPSLGPRRWRRKPLRLSETTAPTRRAPSSVARGSLRCRARGSRSVTELLGEAPELRRRHSPQAWSTIVTGPSFTSSTAMRVPKRPVSTGGPSSRRASQNAS